MRSAIRPLFNAWAWAILAVFFSTASAMAAITVIQSSTPGLEANLTLSETDIIDVPKDAVVVVLKKPECRVLEIKGAYHGTIADYLEQRRGFWERAHSFWDRITGSGQDKSKIPTGATRGLSLQKECG
jgi:hypothetical protein